MWIPLEIVNYIMEYANNGLYLVYCTKYKKHMFKINSHHSRFKPLSELYENVEFFSPITNSTHILYTIPLKKVPSITKRMSDIDDVQNYMSIVVTENEDDSIQTNYYTSIIITKKKGSLLLI